MSYQYNPQGLLGRNPLEVVIVGGPSPSVGGTVTQINQGAGITLTPSPITGAGTVALTIPVTIADGGTNSTTALSNGHVMVSSAGKIIEGSGLFTTGSSLSIGSPPSPPLSTNFMYLGADADTSGAAGPVSLYFTTADSNPLYEMNPYTHDNIQQVYDGYFLSGTWYASDSSFPMRLRKQGGALNIDYGTASGAGTAITWNPALVVSSSLSNPNVQSKVNLYDLLSNPITGEITGTATVTSGGAIAHSFTATCYKNGHTVVMQLVDNSASSNTSAASSITLVNIIPVGFAVPPAGSPWQFGYFLSGATSVAAFFQLSANNVTIFYPGSLLSLAGTAWPNATPFQGGSNFFSWHG
jgi:hypothetical protein